MEQLPQPSLLAVERKRFNEAVATYNTSVRQVPGALVARLGGFERYPLFEAQEAARVAPRVSF